MPSLTCSTPAGCPTEATHVIEHAEFGYTTNIPLADITTDDAIVGYAYEGETDPTDPRRPGASSCPTSTSGRAAKWVRALELDRRDRPGFWERNGYHMYGDPFREQRLTND